MTGISDAVSRPVAAAPVEHYRRIGASARALERSQAHVVIVPTTGTGTHMVDFDDIELRPGAAAHIVPGQVQRFDAAGTFNALVLVVTPAACPPRVSSLPRPVPVIDLGESAPIVMALAADLTREQRGPGPDQELMATAAALVLHHLSRAADAAEPQEKAAHRELLTAFRTEVEGSFATKRSVVAYARTVGTSTKTLARATASLTGLSPKEMIDQRVTLEAKRLLAHSAESISAIASGLGFSEATNFTKFFVRTTGLTPHEFRVS